MKEWQNPKGINENEKNQVESMMSKRINKWINKWMSKKTNKKTSKWINKKRMLLIFST